MCSSDDTTCKCIIFVVASSYSNVLVSVCNTIDAPVKSAVEYTLNTGFLYISHNYSLIPREQRATVPGF